MNAHIAAFLKDKIAALSYVDKIAGLVRPISFERVGKRWTIPVGIEVTDPLNCGDSTLLDLVPSDRYRLIVYFEDRGVTTVKENNRTKLVSRLRLVCWVNTVKLGGDNSAGDRVMQEFAAAIPGAMYNENGYLAIRHKVEGFPAKGKELFAAYTYDDAVRQYLMWPFDAFAIDIATDYRLDPTCEPDPIGTTDVECWTPPTTRRRRNPNEFTCEELTDPDTGLTAEQLGPACLDCGTGGTCTGVDILDNLGNVIAHVDDGDTYTITPMILPYADFATADADVVTVPTTAQMVYLVDSKRMYPGDGASDVKTLVNAQQYLLPVTEAAKELATVVEGDPVKIQLYT